MALLEVNNLEVYYGVIRALKGISFQVNEGEIVSLIGANGAGKTTMMQSVVGIIPKRSGSVIFDGQDITKTPCHKIVKLGMTQVPEGRRIFQELTVYENLMMGAYSVRTSSGLKRIWNLPLNASPVWRNAVGRLQELSPAVSSRCWRCPVR